MTVSCSVCLLAAAIVTETDAQTGQTFWLCPACWTEYLHGLDAGTAASQPDADPGPAAVVPGGEWVCPTCHHRQEIAS